ncbi:MAG TPA: RNA polymerase sigma factor SigJ [Steroidobacteraceae bacterium]|nr:RNA polymerase sigma factor SigJ [Steroidobacteraceae bacterium]
MIDATDAFAERPRVWATAYRLLGSVTDADDAVQTVLLRWLESAPSDVESPIAWLTTAVTRLCIDELRSARRKRVTYVGPWLPEPLVEGAHPLPPDLVERDQSLSLAYLVLLERLGPVERAVFVLHNALDWSHGEIVRALGKSEAACRQILTRARRQLSDAPVATPAWNVHTIELGRRFVKALGRGDIPALMEALDASALLLSDGGGRVLAALQPIRGPDRIGRLVSGLIAKRHEPLTAKEVTVNAAAGLWLEHSDGRPYAVFGLGFSEDGNRVTAIYVMLNPDKMRVPRVWPSPAIS